MSRKGQANSTFSVDDRNGGVAVGPSVNLHYSRVTYTQPSPNSPKTPGHNKPGPKGSQTVHYQTQTNPSPP
ncbi:hypothetical protein SODALDRAFT_356290 [Sodiomyces alkalinus F11]|uniref:Uncharacterized protein n=1 Tax=Sodiomyces alkalinus (strain CBS 110278 / VKM F-3762 / F11) TaxID=1314773 RepID=A0A3N2Q0N4_SODAK|nr:hypothetical protein SODALDRAFT_356290 [Sodiomyces alkalinus F11]ROT40321.1 hypothetical protein SODALDRAFT_356290 [Sodiomyces alkalinus F11]